MTPQLLCCWLGRKAEGGPQGWITPVGHYRILGKSGWKGPHAVVKAGASLTLTRPTCS